jgi:hypothetical protein
MKQPDSREKCRATARRPSSGTRGGILAAPHSVAESAIVAPLAGHRPDAPGRRDQPRGHTGRLQSAAGERADARRRLAKARAEGRSRKS